MTGRVAAAAAIVFIVTIRSAFAHPPPLGLTGFSGGLLHPLFVPAHLLALLALGLLIGQQALWTLKPLLGFVAGLAVGLVVMTSGAVPLFVTEAVMALAIVASVLVVLARPMPEAAGSGFAAMVGAAIGLDSPPETISVSEANRMLLGTGIGAVLLLTSPVWLTRRFNPEQSWIGLRVLASWIAASAILFLALRLVR